MSEIIPFGLPELAHWEWGTMPPGCLMLSAIDSSTVNKNKLMGTSINSHLIENSCGRAALSAFVHLQ
jgi:hypothetical protein